MQSLQSAVAARAEHDPSVDFRNHTNRADLAFPQSDNYSDKSQIHHDGNKNITNTNQSLAAQEQNILTNAFSAVSEPVTRVRLLAGPFAGVGSLPLKDPLSFAQLVKRQRAGKSSPMFVHAQEAVPADDSRPLPSPRKLPAGTSVRFVSTHIRSAARSLLHAQPGSTGVSKVQSQPLPQPFASACRGISFASVPRFGASFRAESRAAASRYAPTPRPPIAAATAAGAASSAGSSESAWALEANPPRSPADEGRAGDADPSPACPAPAAIASPSRELAQTARADFAAPTEFHGRYVQARARRLESQRARADRIARDACARTEKHSEAVRALASERLKGHGEGEARRLHVRWVTALLLVRSALRCYFIIHADAGGSAFQAQGISLKLAMRTVHAARSARAGRQRREQAAKVLQRFFRRAAFLKRRAAAKVVRDFFVHAQPLLAHAQVRLGVALMSVALSGRFRPACLPRSPDPPTRRPAAQSRARVRPIFRCRALRRLREAMRRQGQVRCMRRALCG
jgi:hypothetical protein